MRNGATGETDVMKKLTAMEIAEMVGGRLAGDGTVAVTGVESLDEAHPEQLSFLGNPKYAARVVPSAAGVVLVPEAFDQPAPEQRAWVHCQDPSAAFSQVVAAFAPPEVEFVPGCDATAVVDDSATIPDSVFVGPNAVIEAGVVLGENCVIGAGCYVGHEVHMGSNCRLHPNVTVRERCRLGNQVIVHSGTVIGSDGFGYIPGAERHAKIPQVGIVQIDDDVEIGALVAIDRARFGRTWIKRGAKIDNLVQIAHNVVIGELCFIVAQVGIAGSTRLGRGVIAAGQAGLAGHIEIGDGAKLLAKAGVNKDIPAGAEVVGAPAVDRREFARNLFALGRIGKLSKAVKQLEAEVTDLKAKLGRGEFPPCGA
jgi:UDP-3-O-[3-hydroxymyristoyl] glucosamine N-acyltransferase